MDTTNKGQPGACSSRLSRVRGRIQPLWVLCTPVFSCISTRGCFHNLNPLPHGHKATALLLRQGSQNTVKCECDVQS
jgi:hypothetical protein